MPEDKLFCDLEALDPAERQVVAETEQRLQREVIDVQELHNGLQFKFPGDRDVLETICRWLPLETVCCPFLNFQLEVPQGGAPIHLSMSGGEGVKEFLLQEFEVSGISSSPSR